jgi:hypothetical protein
MTDLVREFVNPPQPDRGELPEPPGTPVAFGHRAHGHPGPHLTYQEARQPPCLSCATSPCCTHLLLGDFHLDGLLDLDHALYLLNFEGIVVGIRRDLTIDVYLHQPCSLLDIDSGLCTVHSTPEQPGVCKHYKSQNCGYRHRMTADVDPISPLLDRERMEWLADHLVFDDHRHVVGAPEWDEMIEAFRSIPRQTRPAPPPPPDPMLEEWRSIVLSEKASPDSVRPRRYGEPEVSNPCQGCEAWCCKMLVFNRGKPTTASQVDFLRYCLGFPGVEVGVADDSWAVIVHTTCRHLDGNRCSVYGTEERPLRCGYYDELNCKYRTHFGSPRPDDIVRISRDQFPLVADSMMFDDTGGILAIPPINVLRGRLEDAERARAQRP